MNNLLTPPRIPFDAATSSPMRMSMMNVREMRMSMGDRQMAVPVLVRLAPIPIRTVLMLVVLVVHVAMAVFPRLMGMPVLVALGQVQPDANGHQCACGPEQ